MSWCAGQESDARPCAERPRPAGQHARRGQGLPAVSASGPRESRRPAGPALRANGCRQRPSPRAWSARPRSHPRGRFATGLNGLHARWGEDSPMPPIRPSQLAFLLQRIRCLTHKPQRTEPTPRWPLPVRRNAKQPAGRQAVAVAPSHPHHHCLPESPGDLGTMRIQRPPTQAEITRNSEIRCHAYATIPGEVRSENEGGRFSNCCHRTAYAASSAPGLRNHPDHVSHIQGGVWRSARAWPSP